MLSCSTSSANTPLKIAERYRSFRHHAIIALQDHVMAGTQSAARHESTLPGAGKLIAASQPRRCSCKLDWRSQKTWEIPIDIVEGSAPTLVRAYPFKETLDSCSFCTRPYRIYTVERFDKA